jgi:hypothetical protein
MACIIDYDQAIFLSISASDLKNTPHTPNAHVAHTSPTQRVYKPCFKCD